jgi:hypothetical protein
VSGSREKVSKKSKKFLKILKSDIFLAKILYLSAVKTGILSINTGFI